MKNEFNISNICLIQIPKMKKREDEGKKSSKRESCNIISVHTKCINGGWEAKPKSEYYIIRINNKTIMDVRILHFQKCTDLGSLSPRHRCCNENKVAKREEYKRTWS